MTNETVANIAVTVTAAMLATAAVAFTLSGNAPTDPRAADLPVVSVESARAQAAPSATPSTTQSVADPAATSASEAGAKLVSDAPSRDAKAGGGTVAASGVTVAAAGAGTASTVTEPERSHDSDKERSDDGHEVVGPKVHDSDEDEDDETPKAKND